MGTPESLPLPGFDDHIAEHTKSAQEVSAEALKQHGALDASAASREMEQHSPLFGSSEANAQSSLFHNVQDLVGNDHHGTTRHEVAFAEHLSIERNLGNARMEHLTDLPSKASVLHVNGYAYGALRKMLQPPGAAHWSGAFIRDLRDGFGPWLEKQRPHLATRPRTQAGIDHILQTLKKLGNNDVVVLRADADIDTVREEIGHTWNQQYFQANERLRDYIVCRWN